MEEKKNIKLFREKISVIVEKTKTGFSAFTEAYDVYTTGKTITELQKNILEALSLYFGDAGIRITSKNITMEIDIKQFFQYYRVINSKYLAMRIGMNPTLLSQYTQGKKIPSHKQTAKIMAGVQEIGNELSELKLIIQD
jgi:predicted RNase H-like HicB family nuclease